MTATCSDEQHLILLHPSRVRTHNEADIRRILLCPPLFSLPALRVHNKAARRADCTAGTCINMGTLAWPERG
ncbi:MAG: hypothetical protein EOO65_01480 [Methanosarcinales archaeon]|nr:MAG: hypothetical protein EOO65_01480 [Methanosarcinales archaeon]